MDQAAGDGGQEAATINDLLLMTFHTRDAREGKGERDLAYWLLLALHERAPRRVEATLELLPAVYGSWKDINRLMEIAAADADELKAGYFSKRAADLAAFVDGLLDLYKEQLAADLRTVAEQRMRAEAEGTGKGGLGGLAEEKGGVGDGGCNGDGGDDFDLNAAKVQRAPTSLSLAAKWAPREKSRSGKRRARELAVKMFADAGDAGEGFGEGRGEVGGTTHGGGGGGGNGFAYGQVTGATGFEGAETGELGQPGKRRCYRQYRRMVADLNERLSTPEVAMCGGRWQEIDPGAVPAKCLKSHRRAFLNLGGKTGRTPRKANDADRVACAARFAQHLGE